MDKNWTGNSKSLWATLGASNHSNVEREKHDYYATDPKTVAPLIGVVCPELAHLPAYEPACGEGHIAEALKSLGLEVSASDLIERGYGEGGVDFLQVSSLKDHNTNIITNPPYKHALEFAEHALKLVAPGCRVAMFLKLTFLEGIKRRAFFERHPPETVAVFSKRQNCYINGDFSVKPSSAACYAWFVWQKGYNGQPRIMWI